MASNKLTLNIKKSQFMIVSNKRNISPITVKINNIPLVNCESYKYLGIHFDQKLSWNTHILNISTKIAKACGMLTKLRHFVPIEILIDVFYALIHSYLRYGILVWGNASNSSLEPLKALINKAVRIISFCPAGNLQQICFLLQFCVSYSSLTLNHTQISSEFF